MTHVYGTREKIYDAQKILGKEKYLKWRNAHYEIETLRREIITAIQQDFSNTEGLVGVFLEDIAFTGGQIKAKLKTYVDADIPAIQSKYIEPALLNTLLHGKLLSNEEKRLLLEQQGITFAKETSK